MKALKTTTIVVGLLVLGFAAAAQAFDAKEFDLKVVEAMAEFDGYVSNSEDVFARANGALVCPKITKVGLGVGLERGLCALRWDGKTHEYWSANSASFGLTAGMQSYGLVLAFMTPEALDKFRKSGKQWEIGADAGVALATVGAGGKVTLAELTDPVTAFAYGQQGLMADVSLAGSRYHKIGDATDLENQGLPFHRFVVTADISEVGGASQTAQMTIDIYDWVTETNRAAVRSYLDEEGTAATIEALRDWPMVGVIKQPGKNVDLRWAYFTKNSDPAYEWKVILGAPEAMPFARARGAAGDIEDQLTIMELDINEERVGTGVLLMGPELSYDANHGLKASARTIKPVKLTSVSYREID